jgi:hypothetical protein
MTPRAAREIISRVEGEVEKLAYEASLRALDKQEDVVRELRSRTGILLAVASLAISVLGAPAAVARAPLAFAALLAFAVAAVASVVVLLPAPRLVFALSGPYVYERLFSLRGDEREAHRRLAYELAEFWRENDRRIGSMVRAYRIAASALVVEIAVLLAASGGRLR